MSDQRDGLTFKDGADLRMRVRLWWEDKTRGGVAVDPSFICATCGKPKPIIDLTLQMTFASNGGTRGICADCHRRLKQ